MEFERCVWPFCPFISTLFAAQGIARANKSAVSRAQCVQKFTILDNDFRLVRVVWGIGVSPYAHALYALALIPHFLARCIHFCSVPGGELGPTLKLRRNIVDKMYVAEVDKMYT